MRADILFVSASSRAASFKAGLDKQGLRMLAVGLPDTLSFGSILSGLGVSAAASLGDMMTVSDTTVLYVPAANGSSNGVPPPGVLSCTSQCCACCRSPCACR